MRLGLTNGVHKRLYVFDQVIGGEYKQDRLRILLHDAQGSQSNCRGRITTLGLKN